jgi:hypothetical protein
VVGAADRRAVLELLVDVTLPKVGGFQDVHIAVENFETILRHDSLLEVQAVQNVQIVQAVRNPQTGVIETSEIRFERIERLAFDKLRP